MGQVTGELLKKTVATLASVILADFTGLRVGSWPFPMYGEVAMMTKLPLDAGEPGALSQLQVIQGLRAWRMKRSTHHPNKTPRKGGGERIV